MKTVFHYLKKSAGALIAVFLLLVLQAYCDLSLPEYTSRIVDVGIAQGGIDSPVPEVLRESTMEKLLYFGEGSEEILSCYERLDPGELSGEELSKLKREYPSLREEPLYRLTKEPDEELSAVMAKPMLFAYALNQEETSAALKEMILSQMPAEMAEAAASMDVLSLLKSLPGEQQSAIISGIEEQTSGMGESMIVGAAVQAVREEYEAVGLDTGKIQIDYILVTGLKMLAVSLVAAACVIIVGFLGARISSGMAMEMRRDVYHKVMNFSNGEMDQFSTASLITRTTNDIQQVQMLILMLIRMVLYAPIVGIGGVFKVISSETTMSWIIAVAVGAILMLVAFMFLFTMPKFKVMQKLVDRLNLVTREILTGLSVIRAFSTETYEEKRFDEANRDLMKTNLFVNRVMVCMMPTMMLIMNLITALIVWVGGNAINDGAIQVGDMMAFIQYTMQIVMAFLMISMVSVMLPRAAVSVSRIREVLSAKESIVTPEDPEDFKESQKGRLEFSHVDFAYPGADEKVLEDISFVAEPGKTTAIIGSTGSGKSTLLNLIPRLYDVTSGEILLDGADIRKVSLKDLRERLGYVPQKGVLFSGTIDSNLRYGKQDASSEELSRAAMIAQAKDFIEEKPEQYQTPIAQGGTNVSGGQKQRLSIARAIVKEPEVYLFDDSFSALDYKTDTALRKALKENTGESTVILVAQRISTVLNADQILVLDEGKVVGKGTHKELMASCEVYRQIALSQLSKEELENE